MRNLVIHPWKLRYGTSKLLVRTVLGLICLGVAGLWFICPLSLSLGARYDHTATTLPDGKVLVVGGYTGTASSQKTIGTVKIYDPMTDLWSAGASLNIKRAEHTATLLPDGKVLVIGGDTHGAGIASFSSVEATELYDPLTDSWTYSGNLTHARVGHTATLLADGRVMVVGGHTARIVRQLKTVELYNPVTGAWTMGEEQNFFHGFNTATLLRDGRVLVIGHPPAGDSTAAELYDPGTDSWSKAGILNEEREQGYSATLLADGRVLVVGGNDGYTSAELYDPDTNTWTLTGNLNAEREQHTASLLADGKVLITGGNISKSTEIYDPATGVWTVTGNFNLPRRHSFAANSLPDGKFLVIGGLLSNGTNTGKADGSAEWFDPATGLWSVRGMRAKRLAFNIALALLLIIGPFLFFGLKRRIFEIPAYEIHKRARWQSLTIRHNLPFAKYDLLQNSYLSGQYRGHRLELGTTGKGYLTQLVTFVRLTPSASRSINSSSSKNNKVIDNINPFLISEASLTRLREKDAYILKRQDWYYYEQPEVELDHEYLRFVLNLLSDLAEVYSGLVAGGGEAAIHLQSVVANKKHPLRRVAISVLEDIGLLARIQLKHRYSSLLCPRCLAGYSAHQIQLNWWKAVTFYGCRSCAQSQEFIKKPQQLVALLDREAVEKQQEDGLLKVNWLRYRQLFDFNRVEIVNATDEDVERFAVQVGNDIDETRRRTYQAVSCVIQSTCNLSDNTFRILRATFGQVSSTHFIPEGRKNSSE